MLGVPAPDAAAGSVRHVRVSLHSAARQPQPLQRSPQAPPVHRLAVALALDDLCSHVLLRRVRGAGETGSARVTAARSTGPLLAPHPPANSTRGARTHSCMPPALPAQRATWTVQPHPAQLRPGGRVRPWTEGLTMVPMNELVRSLSSPMLPLASPKSVSRTWPSLQGRTVEGSEQASRAGVTSRRHEQASRAGSCRASRPR
jgi:hypothetical protein